MKEKLESYLKDLEQKLMHAESREEAQRLINNYDKQSLEAIQGYLKAHTRTKNRHGIIQAILNVTYDAYRRHKIITNKD